MGFTLSCRWLAALTLLVFAGCANDPSQRVEPPDRTSAGEHYRVTLHFGDGRGELAVQALVAAEAVWPYAVELYGARQEVIDPPLEIHVYQSARDYERVEMKLTKGAFRRNLGFSHLDSQTAHIALQPRVSNKILGRIGLPPQTLRLIAHEALHLASYHCVSSAKWLPDWLDEGAATWAEQRVMARLGFSAVNDDDDVWSSTYHHLVAEMHRTGRLPGIDGILRDDLDALQGRERYALHKVFFSFLKTKYHSRLETILAKARELREGPAFAPTLLESIRKIFGSDFGQLDFALSEYIASLRPRWFERRRSLECAGEEWIQIAFADADAISIRTEEVSEGLSLRGAFEILDGGGHQLFIVLGDSPERFVSVGFEAGYGVLVTETIGGKREALASSDCRQIVTGREVPFSLLALEGRLQVSVDGKPLIDIELPRATDARRWGLGARKGTAGIWHGLQIGPPPGRLEIPAS